MLLHGDSNHSLQLFEEYLIEPLVSFTSQKIIFKRKNKMLSCFCFVVQITHFHFPVFLQCSFLIYRHTVLVVCL